jgi:hypothetical protein
MASASRLGRQIEEIVDTLNRMGAPYALIGGLALAPYNVTRATRDVDLLIEGTRSTALDIELLGLGYRCLHRTEDAANYQRGDERLDFLYATRPIALRLLNGARKLSSLFGEIPVVSVEGLIAFKLQGVVNDPRRTQDLEDIRALMRANRAVLKLDELREYFRMFEREPLLAELLNEPA